MRQDKRLNFLLLFFSFLLLNSACLAVNSKITRHSSSVDFLKGEIKDIVVSSEGTIQLGRAAETMVKAFEDVWSINSIVVSGETVFVGTSPNGGIYKYSLGKLTKIYPADSDKGESEKKNKEQKNRPKECKNCGEQGIEGDLCQTCIDGGITIKGETLLLNGKVLLGAKAAVKKKPKINDTLDKE